jgi:hypothetical protein
MAIICRLQRQMPAEPPLCKAGCRIWHNSQLAQITGRHSAGLLGKRLVQKKGRDFFQPRLAAIGAKKGKNWGKRGKKNNLFLVLFGGRKKAGKLKQQKNCSAPAKLPNRLRRLKSKGFKRNTWFYCFLVVGKGWGEWTI